MPNANRYRVRLTRRALRDIDEILTWMVAQVGASIADKWLAEISAAVDTLERMPERCGRIAEAEEIAKDIRELYFGKRQGRYRILFEIRRLTVVVVHVRHGARDAIAPGEL